MQIPGLNIPTGADAQRPDRNIDMPGRGVPARKGMPDRFIEVFQSLFAPDAAGADEIRAEAPFDMPVTSRESDTDDDAAGDDDPDVQPNPERRDISQPIGKIPEIPIRIVEAAVTDTTETPGEGAGIRLAMDRVGGTGGGGDGPDPALRLDGWQTGSKLVHQPEGTFDDGPAPLSGRPPAATVLNDEMSDPEYPVKLQRGKPSSFGNMTSPPQSIPTQTSEAPPRDPLFGGPTDANRLLSGSPTPANMIAYRPDTSPLLPATAPPEPITRAELSAQEADAPQSGASISRPVVPQDKLSENLLAESPDQRNTPAALPTTPRPSGKPLPVHETGRGPVPVPADTRVSQPEKAMPEQHLARPLAPESIARNDGVILSPPSPGKVSVSPDDPPTQARWPGGHGEKTKTIPHQPRYQPRYQARYQAQVPPDAGLGAPTPAIPATASLKAPDLPRPTVVDSLSGITASLPSPSTDLALPGMTLQQPASALAPLTIALVSPGISHNGSAGFPAQVADILAQTRDRKIEIALHPKELGHVRMSMAMSDSGVTVSISADRPETLDLMRRHIDSLSGALQSLGHQNVAFDFSGAGNPQPGTANTILPEAEPPDDPVPEPAPVKPAQSGNTRDLDMRL